MLVAELYPRFFMMSGRQRIGIAVGIFLYNVFLWTVKSCGIETLGSRGARTSGLLLIIFYIGFFLFQKYKLDSYHILPKIIMAIFMILSVGIHGYYRFSMDGESYVKEFLDVGTALESLEPQGVKMLKSVEDDGLYRVHAEGYRYKNYGLLNHLNTISGYYSITAAETTDTIKSYETLGMKYADKYHGLDQRLGLLSLAGVKYMTVSEEGHVDRWTKSCDDVPYGFQKLKTQGDISLYENPYALPFGYGYDSYITKKQYDALNGVGREQAMLKNAVVEEELKNTDLREEKVFDNVSVTTIPLSEKRISSPNGKEYADVSVPVNADKEIYLYFKNLIYEDNISNGANLFMHGKKGSKGIIVEQNGIRKKIHIQSTFNPYYFGRKDYMIKLNHHETSGKEKVRLKFLSPGTYQFKQMYLVVVDKDATLAKIKNLQHNTLKDIELDDNRFSGRMIAEKENMVCITIPYSKGWRATVDGKKAEIHKINGMYMGVLVKKGNHRIELDYTTPGIRIGCIISIAVWGMFFCLERILMKNKRICSKDIEGLDNKDENGIIETENYDELQKYGGK